MKIIHKAQLKRDEKEKICNIFQKKYEKYEKTVDIL